MRHRFWLVVFLLSSFLLRSEGFAPETLVKSLPDCRPIKEYKINDYVVLAEKDQYKSYGINNISSCVANFFVRIEIKDVSIDTMSDQKFYSCTRNDWVSAGELNVSEKLLCNNGKIVCIDSIEPIYQQQKMYALSVETSHIFCITPYEIIVHNFEPMLTTGVVSALSLTCPPVTTGVAAASVVAFCIVNCAAYCMHRLFQNKKIKKEGCFAVNKE